MHGQATGFAISEAPNAHEMSNPQPPNSIMKRGSQPGFCLHMELVRVGPVMAACSSYNEISCHLGSAFLPKVCAFHVVGLRPIARVRFEATHIRQQNQGFLPNRRKINIYADNSDSLFHKKLQCVSFIGNPLPQPINHHFCQSCCQKAQQATVAQPQASCL